MHLTLIAIATTAFLFGLMVLALEGGRRFGRRRGRAAGKDDDPGTGAVDGAVFGLLGLLMAFTFSGAAARFDARRQLVVDEANAVGTAWLRLDLLPTADRPALRDEFRRYVDARLRLHRSAADDDAVDRELAQVAASQRSIWSLALAAVERDGRPQVATLVVPALNEMFDIGTTRTAAMRRHVPPIIIGLLLALALLASLLAGYGTAAHARSWFHIVMFAAITALTIYVILDFEYPRVGLIRLAADDRVLIDVRQSFD
jgi:hypothetical protein